MRAAAAATALSTARSLLLGLLLLLLLLGAPRAVPAQQLTPFQGQGVPPAGAEVFVSVVVDRLLNIDDRSYQFEAVLFIYLSWNDSRAAPAVANASTSGVQTCARPCTTLAAWQPGSRCCDGVWLPHLEFTNVRGFSQDRVLRYGIRLDKGTEAVGWWSHVHGVFYTPMSFAAFPFDRQILLVQVDYANIHQDINVTFTPSATGLQLYQPHTGVVLPGWNVDGIEILPFKFSSSPLAQSDSRLSATQDPWPLNPSDGDTSREFRGYLWYDGWVAAIYVSRISSYYVIYAVLPVALSTLLSLLVFAIDPKHLDTRLGIVVTLFLALTALQFVVAAVLPSSATVVPTQQLCLISYLLLGLIGIESILVYWLVTAEKRLTRRRRIRRAGREFQRRWSAVVSSVHSASVAHTAKSKWLRLRKGRPKPQQQQQQPSSGTQLPPAPTDGPSGLGNGGESQEAAAPGNIKPAAQQTTGDRFGGLGMYAQDISSSGGSDGSSRSGAAAARQESRERTGVMEHAEQHQQLRQQQAAAAGEDAVPVPPSDPEAGRAWRCCLPVAKKKAAKATARPGWLRLQGMKLREVWKETHSNHEYAELCADRIDRITFWVALAGFLVAIIAIFATQSQVQPALVLI